MNTSLFELFKIGIGPSSSHTVGPMKAALRFVTELAEGGLLGATARVQADLYGSLAHTGKGHATDLAILLGLSGLAPDRLDAADRDRVQAELAATAMLRLGGTTPLAFFPVTDLLFHTAAMFPPEADPAHSHPNGLTLTAFDPAGQVLRAETFYSVGGGFIVTARELAPDPQERQLPGRAVPFPFRSAEQLLKVAQDSGRSIAELILANETALLQAELAKPTLPRINRPALPDDAAARPEQAVAASILALWRTMNASIERGIATEGTLPGGLKVRRRAPGLSRRIAGLDNKAAANGLARDPLAPLDWVSLFAIAVNEENAAGGRVVTAPTNGAAGVVPAIARYYTQFIAAGLPEAERDGGLLRLFLTAAAIGILYKENASISGAEVGCQGEVGVACSMAAGGLAAALGATNAQIEHAAEIAMEHNLGMTCDPIGGLVQIPCIERNAMGAVKAVNATRMAMHETEGHKLSLDQVIATMYRTGMDMQSRYKETSEAGLALNIIEC